MNDTMEESLQCLEAVLGEMDEATRTLALNTIRRRLHTLSPFRSEPVDCGCRPERCGRTIITRT